jgi:hypothetical protein
MMRNWKLYKEGFLWILQAVAFLHFFFIFFHQEHIDMGKAYQKTDPLFIKIDNRVWGIPFSNSSSTNESSGEESPLSSMGSVSSLIKHNDLSSTANIMPSEFFDRPQQQVFGLQEDELAAAGPSCSVHNETDQETTTSYFMNHNMQRISNVRQADFESAMYHQHLIPTNESIACIQPENITLSYPSCSEKTSIITSSSMYPTTVNKAPIETLIENLDQVQPDQQQLDQQVGPSREPLEDTNISSLYQSETTSKGLTLLPPKKNFGKNLVLFTKRKHLSDAEPSEITLNASAPIETPAPKKKNKRRVRFTSPTKDSSIESSARPIIKKKQKRTVTSYDSQTSFYLKSVFFEVYSCQNKLTKYQRAQVQKKTGLPSRNITYWFSNHKRRFQQTLAVYRKTVEDSKGSIKNYTDFLEWRRTRGLPDQISQAEVKELADKEHDSKSNMF